MNRADLNKYLTTVSNEVLLDIRADIEIEYIKRVLYKQGASLLKTKFAGEKVINYNGTNLNASNVAKQFYKLLDKDFFVNKYKFHKILTEKQGCLLSTIQKRLNIIFDQALISANSEVLNKQFKLNNTQLKSNLQK